MKSKTPRASSRTHSTRRGFLKTTGAAGAALAGGLTAPLVYSSSELERASSVRQCGFAALPSGFIYLNSGTEGSMPECVLSSYQNGLEKWASNPTTSYELDPVLGKRQELNREQAARFLGVSKNNICLTDNTTMGLSMTLMGLNFRPGDRVIITNHEHNAIKSPLQVLRERLGLQIETRPFPSAEKLSGMGSAELLEFLLPDTPALRGARALCVSHVYPTTGVRLPLRALRKKADELNIPYIRNADIRPPEFYPTISQRMGKYSDCNEDSLSCFPIAEALQVRGCSNTPGFAAMISAMQFAQDAGGAAQIEKHILGLSKVVKNTILTRSPSSLISPHSDASLLSGLTAFFPFNWDNPQTIYRDKKTADRVVKELLEKDIQVRSIGFSNAGEAHSSPEQVYAIRVSTAYFNTSQQIEIFKKALPEVLV
jgi:selenocysteine lyase/cysteine desulfurase